MSFKNIPLPLKDETRVITTNMEFDQNSEVSKYYKQNSF